MMKTWKQMSGMDRIYLVALVASFIAWPVPTLVLAGAWEGFCLFTDKLTGE